MFVVKNSGGTQDHTPWMLGVGVVRVAVVLSETCRSDFECVAD